VSTEIAESVLRQMAHSCRATGLPVVTVRLHRDCKLVPIAALIAGSPILPLHGTNGVEIKVPRLLNNENRN
jgi:hypothetical protein